MSSSEGMSLRSGTRKTPEVPTPKRRGAPKGNSASPKKAPGAPTEAVGELSTIIEAPSSPSAPAPAAGPSGLFGPQIAPVRSSRASVAAPSRRGRSPRRQLFSSANEAEASLPSSSSAGDSSSSSSLRPSASPSFGRGRASQLRSSNGDNSPSLSPPPSPAATSAPRGTPDWFFPLMASFFLLLLCTISLAYRQWETNSGYMEAHFGGLSCPCTLSPSESLPGWPRDMGFFWKPAVSSSSLALPSGIPTLGSGSDNEQQPGCPACPVPTAVPISKVPASLCETLTPFHTLTQRQILWLNERSGWGYSLSTPAWQEFNALFSTSFEYEELVVAWQMSDLGPIDPASHYADVKPWKFFGDWPGALVGIFTKKEEEVKVREKTYESRRCEECRTCTWRLREGLLGGIDEVNAERARELASSSSLLSASASALSSSSSSLAARASSAAQSSASSPSSAAFAAKEAAAIAYEKERRARGWEWGRGLLAMKTAEAPSAPTNTHTHTHTITTTKTVRVKASASPPPPPPKPRSTYKELAVDYARVPGFDNVIGWNDRLLGAVNWAQEKIMRASSEREEASRGD